MCVMSGNYSRVHYNEVVVVSVWVYNLTPVWIAATPNVLRGEMSRLIDQLFVDSPVTVRAGNSQVFPSSLASRNTEPSISDHLCEVLLSGEALNGLDKILQKK
jgi:hypothetical protein